MSKIIMFGNQKGGVGKSQVSIMTATALSQSPFKLKVCIVDSDAQKSVCNARNLDLRAYNVENAPYSVIGLKVPELQNKIAELDKAFDVVIIDAAGKLDIDLPTESQEITKILMYVDVLFMPFVAGNHNLDATVQYFKFVRHIQKIRQIQPRQLKVFGFVNMHRSRSRANAFLIEDIENLKQSDNLEMMQTVVNDYSAFRDADTVTSLYGLNTSDSAKANFTAFLNELITLIQ